jgi:DNA-directed RNA polymerase specialized sigma24 family protein
MRMVEGDEDKVRMHLALAVQAAERQDVRGFFLEVAASHGLDGIVRGLCAAWPLVEVGAVEAIVAEAVETLYEKVAVDRAVIDSAGGFLWGTAKNKIRERHRAGVLDTIPLVEGTEGLTVESPGGDEERDPDELRAEALRRARALLPRLGGEVLTRVMGFIFDAIEHGEPMIPNEMIAGALGLTRETVRRSKSRGFQRLASLARLEGFDLTGIEVDPGNDNGDDAGDE